MPAVAILILQFVSAAMSAAPGVVQIAKDAQALFAALFSKGVITKEQQDKLNARVNEILGAALTGTFPSYWDVEPDPVTPATVKPAALVVP